MNEYELDENSDMSQPCPRDEYSEDDGFSLDSRIASQNLYYGRWLQRSGFFASISADAALSFCRVSDQ